MDCHKRQRAGEKKRVNFKIANRSIVDEILSAPYEEHKIGEHQLAVIEARELGLFKEYTKLKGYDSAFKHGRFMVFDALVDMLRFDPVLGIPKLNMNQPDTKHWEDIANKIQRGGFLLSHCKGVVDPGIWEHTPQRFHADLNRIWAGVDGWADTGYWTPR